METQSRQESPEFVLDHFEEVEGLAEEIVTDKHQIIDLDRKRNKNREALRALGKMQPVPGKDQNNIESEIGKLRDNLKPKVSKLRELEGRPEAKGFNLEALSRDEINAVHY
uniref:P53 and DNA damage-regulated protein 1-like n=1 Tax=Saccoglossus kowalevskii TaxID=10224 RepID=A0ABM0M2S6_SACKO|nr:PREDICTED: p53 and DNA damage-regulated protein 1-like [Saccoglossus kowalevskii]